MTTVPSHPTASATPPSPGKKTRILLLGGGFGSVWTARHLERLFAREPEVEIVLVSRDNFFLMTPLLFEVCSGVLGMRNCSLPIREYLRRCQFVEATVRGLDLDRKVVRVAAAEGNEQEIAYDQLIVGVGAWTNQKLIPGSESAFTFKTLADAMVLRNHVIERFERADVETDLERKRRLLTFAVIGGGLVGVELFGELTAFADAVVRYYRQVRRDEVRFFLFQADPRILPEIPEKLAAYAETLLRKRSGVDIRTRAAVRGIAPGKIHLEGETIEAGTIVLAAGITPSSLVTDLPIDRDARGHIRTDGTLQSTSRPEVWALGDCAQVPDADGKPYPYLAQHALREGKVLARNLHATITGRGTVEPFTYKTLGVMASLGHNKGIGQVLGVPLRGFLAWWVRRTYYLFMMPRWRRRIPILIDWTLGLFFRPDLVKVDLASELVMIARDHAAGATETLREIAAETA